jgi:hypothetical protein
MADASNLLLPGLASIIAVAVSKGLDTWRSRASSTSREATDFRRDMLVENRKLREELAELSDDLLNCRNQCIHWRSRARDLAGMMRNHNLQVPRDDES